MIAGGELDSDDGKSLLDHAEEWERIANESYPATDYMRQTCRKVAKQFRLEHETGIRHCGCCLLPDGKCRFKR